MKVEHCHVTLLSINDGHFLTLPFLLPNSSNTCRPKTTMAPIGSFSAWKAPFSAYDPDSRQFQEVIFYCASRFRAAAISIANGLPKDWFQICPLTELVRESS